MHPATLHCPAPLDRAALAPVISAWEDWWDGRNDRALVYGMHPGPGASLTAAVRPWMSPKSVSAWSHWQQELVFGDAFFRFRRSRDPAILDQAIDLILHNLGQTRTQAEGFQFLLPGFGPSMLAGCITGHGLFKDTTIWYDTEEPWSLERVIAGVAAVPGSAHLADVETALARLVARVGGRAVLAPPEVGNPVDVLSAVRGNSNLAMDLVEDPDGVERALAAIETLYRTLVARWSDAVEAANGGLSTVSMRYLAARRSHMAYCDFSGMISPRHFDRFVRPIIERDAAMAPGRLSYHLDGVGALPHLKALCDIPGLGAIQWVQGAGKPESVAADWDPVYRRIIDSGKRICLCAALDPAGLRALFGRFPARHFLVPAVGNGADEVARIVDVCKG